MATYTEMGLSFSVSTMRVALRLAYERSAHMAQHCRSAAGVWTYRRHSATSFLVRVFSPTALKGQHVKMSIVYPTMTLDRATAVVRS